MKKEYIAVIDSGVGGLSLLDELVKAFPSEQFLYFGDNYNAPYGNRSELNLKSLMMKNLDFIMRYKLKAIVLACNTLSLNLLHYIKSYTGILTFGIYPPVEQEVVSGNRVLLLSTMLTYNHYKNLKSTNFDCVGLPYLASDIEKNILDLSKININKMLLNQSIGGFKYEKYYYDTLILGCTHYNFVKIGMNNHLCPQNIISGDKNTISMMKKTVLLSKSSVKYNGNDVLFIGDNKEWNKFIFKKYYQI